MLMQNEIAGVGRRVVATVLDLVILHLALSIVTRGMVLSPAGMWGLDFVLAVCYSALFLGLRGQTPGKMALRLRVMGSGGGVLMYGQTFKRSVLKWAPIFGVFVLLALVMPSDLRVRPPQEAAVTQVALDPIEALGSSVVLVVGTVGWLWLVHTTRRHPDGQALHDRMSETFVVQVP